MVFFIAGGVLFLILGFGIHIKKWHFLISGYNTMSKEKKKNVDVEKLGKLMGLYMYSNGLLMILAGILGELGVDHVITIWVAFMFLSTAYLLIKAQRYDGNMVDKKGKWTGKGKREMKLVYAILVVSALFVLLVFQLTSKPIQVDTGANGFEISGIYGSAYSWSSVEEVALLEKLPIIEKRTNGSEWGSMLKGNFRTSEYGTIKLFVDTEKAPYVFVRMDGQIVIFNLKDPESTRSLYEIFQKKSDLGV